MGSIIDAKKAPVENIAKAMDMLAASMAAKKVIQCKAIIIPAIDSLMRDLKSIDNFIPLTFINNNIKAAAINIRNHTNGIAEIEISLPKIAVKPAINTKRCKCK